MASPFALGYMHELIPDANVLRVMGERDLPSIEIRNRAMLWSDVISGILVVIFSALSASPTRRYPWAQWANATVGLWLLFAPLVFWTPLPLAYINSTLIGSLVIAFALVIPPMPGMSVAGMTSGPDIPLGWNYSPASWPQRLPIAVLGLIGFFIASYMAAYQARTFRSRVGSVFRRRHHENHHLGYLTSVADCRCRARRGGLCARSVTQQSVI